MGAVVVHLMGEYKSITKGSYLYCLHVLTVFCICVYHTFMYSIVYFAFMQCSARLYSSACVAFDGWAENHK